MDRLLSVSEAAKELKVSPARVRAMVSHGDLLASKVGGRWLIHSAVVFERGRKSNSAGRPLEPHNAWALILLASGETVEGLDPSVRSRLKRAVATRGIEAMAERLSKRAEIQTFSAHPGEVSHLLEDDSLVNTGISAAGKLGLGLVSGSEVDGYLPVDQRDTFVRRHALVEADVDGNVRLRLVPSAARRFLNGRDVAPAIAVALDLSEDADARSAYVGRSELQKFDRVTAGKNKSPESN